MLMTGKKQVFFYYSKIEDISLQDEKKSGIEKHGHYVNKIKTLKNFRHDLRALAQRSSLRRSLTWSILIATSTDKPTVKPIFSRLTLKPVNSRLGLVSHTTEFHAKCCQESSSSPQIVSL